MWYRQTRFAVACFLSFNFCLDLFTDFVHQVFTFTFQIITQRQPFKPCKLQLPETEDRIDLFIALKDAVILILIQDIWKMHLSFGTRYLKNAFIFWYKIFANIFFKEMSMKGPQHSSCYTYIYNVQSGLKISLTALQIYIGHLTYIPLSIWFSSSSLSFSCTGQMFFFETYAKASWSWQSLELTDALLMM
jgi:hypothetical protein